MFYFQGLETPYTYLTKNSYSLVSWYISFSETGALYEFITVNYTLVSNTPNAIKYFISNSSLKNPHCMPNYTQSYQLPYTNDYSKQLVTQGLCALSVYNFSFTVSRPDFESVVKYYSFTTGNQQMLWKKFTHSFAISFAS